MASHFICLEVEGLLSLVPSPLCSLPTGRSVYDTSDSKESRDVGPLPPRSPVKGLLPNPKLNTRSSQAFDYGSMWSEASNPTCKGGKKDQKHMFRPMFFDFSFAFNTIQVLNQYNVFIIVGTFQFFSKICSESIKYPTNFYIVKIMRTYVDIFMRLGVFKCMQ